MKEYQDLIQQLKNRQEELGLSQTEIAEIMQTERVRVNELFSTRKTNMTVKTLIKLCKALRVKIKISPITINKNKSF